MMFKIRLLAILIVCGFLPACMSVIVHDEKAAARAANQFARAAFVDRDDLKAHGLLSPALAKQIPAETLSETVAKMHPKSFPAQVTATEFEPIPGQKAMMIFLKGTSDGEEFYYRFAMEGDAPSGYRVAGLFRGSGPYPKSNRGPLKLFPSAPGNPE